MKQQIYKIRLEVNDHGWNDGYYSFKNVADAVKHMRRVVAKLIMDARRDGEEVKLLKVFRDSVTWAGPGLDSQTINVRIGADFFEYRVFAYDLYSEGEMPNNLNY